MPDAPNRRERRKARTRRAISDAALRQFAARGVDATSVESICEEADVAVSTFYAHFESKEASAFPTAGERAALVEQILSDRPDDEPLHVTLRRAAHAVVAEDLRERDELLRRVHLLAREPRLAAHAARLQGRSIERFSRLLAGQAGGEPTAVLRRRLAVSAVFGALDATWSTWARDPSADLHGLVDLAHDMLDAGLGRTFQQS